MPDERQCICVPRSIRAVQRECYTAQVELQLIEDRLEAARHGILLPADSARIFEGEKRPTVESEIFVCLGVLLDDHIPEMRTLLNEATIATPRRVVMAWNRLHRDDG